VGAEFEFTAKPTERLDIGISGTILDAQYDSTVRDGTGAVIGGIRNGNRLPTVPRFQISANTTYTAPIGDKSELFISGSVQHVGNRFTQPSDQEPPASFFTSRLRFGGATGTEVRSITTKLPSYEIVNLSIGVNLESGLSIIGYVNNVFDENALLSLDRERGGRARIGFATNTPRTYGVTVRQSF
jgi:iron complex outermembrane recepter protein